jgi:aminopeptidase N
MACLVHGLGDGGGGASSFAEPGVGRSYAPSRCVRIEHIGLVLRVWPEVRTFSGEARLTWRALPTFDGRVRFDLDEVTVGSVVDADGRPLTWAHRDTTLEVRYGDDAVRDGVIVVTWRGQDPIRGLHFTGPTPHAPDRCWMAWTQNQDENAHFLLPCHDHPGTRHPWSVRVEGPIGATLLSNGAQTGAGEADGRAWATFEQRAPMPAYLLTIVAAPLEVVHGDGPVPVRFLVPAGGTDRARANMGQTGAMMRLITERTGAPFPWPRYDQVVVHDFIFGGMENTACTTMTELLLADDRALLEWSADALVMHELAHQWFGDLVTCRDWSQAWLNESWATFFEAEWERATRGEAAEAWYRWHQACSYFDEDAGRYRRPIESYTFRSPIDVFDRHLYEKGAVVLATLRTVVGEAPFWAGVRHYLETNAHRPVHTRDFQRAMEEATGVDLGRFFDQWVRGAGHPELAVSLGEEPGLVTVTVRQGQRGDGTAEVFHLPLRIEIVASTGDTLTLDLPIRERERTWAVPFAGKVATVRVDPGFRVLAAITIEGPRPWLTRAVYDACPVVSVRAARALHKRGAPPDLEALRGALTTHPFFGVRAEIAALFGRVGGDAARDALIAALASEQDPRARRSVAEALGGFRSSEAAGALIASLPRAEHGWHLLASTLVALGKTRDPRAAASITPYLSRDAWAELVRRAAMDGLAATADVAVLADLLAAGAPGAPDRVRAGLCVALARLAELCPEVRPRAVERVCAIVREPGFYAVLAACAALGAMRDPAASPTLRHLHTSGTDGRQRRAAYEALQKIEAGANAEAALTSVRRRLEELAEENQALRARVDRLERPA